MDKYSNLDEVIRRVRNFRKVTACPEDLAPLNKIYGNETVFLAWKAAEILEEHRARRDNENTPVIINNIIPF